MPSKEFQNKICKATSKRRVSLSTDYHSKDFYKYIRQYINIEEKLLAYIVRDLQKGIAKYILGGKKVVLPHLGTLELRKFKRSIKMIDGVVKTNLPINWKATLDLWETDERAYKDRVLIRLNMPYIYRVYYIHTSLRFKNLPFIRFKLSRRLKRALTPLIQDKEIDAFLLK